MNAVEPLPTQALKIHIAKGFWCRARGLLGRSHLAIDQGLYLPRCNSVHTFGMRFPIDVVFIDSANRVVKLVSSLMPMRAAYSRNAVATLELAAGQAEAYRVEVGGFNALINQSIKDAS